MSERLNDIEMFVHAAQAGSFAQAATRLRMTRSAVAKGIARLEERLGVRLFNRTTRSLSLTEDGHAYYERCVRALAELDAAEAVFDTRRSSPEGCLRVSAPVHFGRRCVAPLLLELANQHRGLSIEMSFSDRVVDLVEENLDLAVCIGALPDSASLAARRLGEQRMGICAAPSYLAKHGLPTSAEEVEEHQCIVYGPSSRHAPWRIRDRDGVRAARPNGRVYLDDWQAIADTAVAGAGLAWLPCWLLSPYLRSGELTLVMNSDRVLATSIYAVWPKNRHLPAKTRFAIDLLAARIPAMMGYPEAEQHKHEALQAREHDAFGAGISLDRAALRS
jgi:DNA-binding transcriptional LysR family regulator